MLHFLTALNEQATWLTIDDTRAWASTIAGRDLLVTEEELSKLDSDLSFIRKQLSFLHFGEGLEVYKLDERLSEIQLSFALPADAGLPALRARLKGKTDWEFLKSLRDTLLLQFANFLSEAMAEGGSQSIARCEGLYRPELYVRRQGNRDQEEARWRGEMPILAESGAVVNEIERCEDFFVPSKAAKFCSDACRFNTFQIKKKLSNPDYLADKQRRYRNRKNKSSS